MNKDIETLKQYLSFIDSFDVDDLDIEERYLVNEIIDEIDARHQEILEEFTELNEEETDEYLLFPNGRDYDAEDEDGI